VVCLCLLAVLLIFYFARQGPAPASTQIANTGSLVVHNDSIPSSNATDMGLALENNSTSMANDTTSIANNTSVMAPSPQPSGKGPGQFAGGKPPGDMKGPPSGDWKNGQMKGQMPGKGSNATAGNSTQTDAGQNATAGNSTQSNAGQNSAPANLGTTASGNPVDMSQTMPGIQASTPSSSQSLFDWESSYLANVTNQMPNLQGMFNSQ